MSSETDIIAFEPEKILRDLIGADTQLAEIFTKERIEACQSTIDNARGAFFDVANEELMKLENLVKSQKTGVPISDAIFEDIAAKAANIRGHAEMFGFTPIGMICGYIIEYSEPGAHALATRFQLIAGLTRLLRLAIREKISDDRGVLARELTANLKRI